MFNYQFPASPYTVDLKEARGEYDPMPERQHQFPERPSLRVRLAMMLHAWADRLEPALRLAQQSQSAPAAKADRGA